MVTLLRVTPLREYFRRGYEALGLLFTIIDTVSLHKLIGDPLRLDLILELNIVDNDVGLLNLI